MGTRKTRRRLPPPVVTEIDSVKTDKWYEAYDRLREYVAREGHARVPCQHREKGFSLGRWVYFQRKGKDGLHADLRSGLEQLPGWIWTVKSKRTWNDWYMILAALEQLPGWVWSVQNANWEAKYKLLLRVVDRRGTAIIPREYIEDGRKLGQWVRIQR